MNSCKHLNVKRYLYGDSGVIWCKECGAMKTRKGRKWVLPRCLNKYLIEPKCLNGAGIIFPVGYRVLQVGEVVQNTDYFNSKSNRQSDIKMGGFLSCSYALTYKRGYVIQANDDCWVIRLKSVKGKN
jgi:hypothetical protein